MSRASIRGLGIVVVVGALWWATGCTGERTGAGQGTEQCTFCHGDPANFPGDNLLSAAPPKGLERDVVTLAAQLDRTATTNPGVGAHQVHLREGALSRAVACTDCHLVPSLDGQDYSDVALHMGGTYTSPDPTPNRADLTFAGRAVLGGVQASYDYTAFSCNAYCHGVTLYGGTNTAPVWTKVGEGQADCGTCHGLPPEKPGHPQSTLCYRCHPTVDADMNIIDKDRHIDGTVDLVATACTTCHGSTQNPAPPVDTQGRSDTSLTSVGAHQSHLGSTISAPVACSECHIVPTDLGHVDGVAEVVFGTLAQADGASPTWNGTTCQAYCHGQTIPGGSNKTPNWTTVDGSQAACGTCHSLPPTGGHPTDTRCYVCHPTVDASGAIVRTDLHINGQVETRGTACNSCHGSDVNDAPPVDTQGRSDTTLTSVGAHQAHLVNGTYSDPVACNECHVVPTDLSHIDGTAEVVFGTLAHARGFTATDWSGTTCSVYCHGASIAGGSNKTPDWTAGSSQAACGTCHSLPPTGTHDPVGATSCSQCHGMVINADMTWNNKHLHINGQVDVSFGSACDSCHDAPPHTGAHLKHFGGTLAQVAYGDTSATADNAAGATPSYIFGCGNCHPLDPAKHRNGVVDIELHNASAPGSSLKALTPASASYTPGGTTLYDGRGLTYTLGTCGNVYCHSGRGWTTPNGVPLPTTSSTPPAGSFFWNGVYPIVYPQPVDNYVTVTRTYQSIGWGAASPGCGGCHGNPPQTSTIGGNAAGAGDSHSFINGAAETLHNRFSAAMGSGTVACRGCHYQTVTTAPATITDARFHVNGQNDVAFDQTRTYTVRGSSRSLVGATYNTSTRVCSVSCHNADRNDTPRWGDPYRDGNQPECLRCHDGQVP